MALESFHPAVRDWFTSAFAQATPVQDRAWRAIAARQHTLIAAPTGSGKTLAAFLAVIDELVKSALQGTIDEGTSILYVSPLKALSNDIHKNLEQPLAGISRNLQQTGHGDISISAAVRSGDTPAYAREQMRRRPPHILVTTPESLFILLTSDSGRAMLSAVRTVIVDEIHAVISTKRGSHLALSLERLQSLTTVPLVRIGLSATQKPVQAVADYLVGNRCADCTVIDCGYTRERDLAVVVPETPLSAVMSAEGWQDIYDRLTALINEHTTTLIFVNTRRLAERVARFLAERMGEENVTAHHGSLAREHRLRAEQQLKSGRLKALVATASLELGIDIGDIDLVCQLGSPRSIAAFLQRTGRSGHRLGAVPRGRLFPLSRDDLVECTALLRAVNQDRLDTLNLPEGHLDVLAQQIIAEVGCGEWPEAALYDMITRAWPYRDLKEHDYQALLVMLMEGFTTRRGPRARYLFRDAVNGRVKPRKGARLAAVTNAGAIPDQFDYDVVLEPENIVVGTLNEDFAFESLAGDVFQLGNTSYRILQVSQGKVRVADAHGQPPNIPFWFGEAPGRSDELSRAVSALRTDIAGRLEASMDTCRQWLQAETRLDTHAARQLVAYLAAGHAALGRLPDHAYIVLERFFDDAGDQHVVVHSPYGVRINRAWGLALRKRFCRRFNFELQAAALDDYIVLSLGATHSFPLEDIKHYLKSTSVREVLKQAMLAAPMFATHWRWNASIALAVKRFRNGKRTPPAFQRTDAEDLMALVFPDQLACQENLAGEREIPDHPLVRQTVNDCLHDIMDIEGLEQVLKDIEDGTIDVIARDLAAPSPLAEEILNARPYAFLDDAPAEERRTRAIRSQNLPDPLEAGNLGRLDPEAIQRVRDEAWPRITNADELHDAMYQLGFLLDTDFVNPQALTTAETLLDTLVEQQRARQVKHGEQSCWICAERLAQFHTAWPDTDIGTPPKRDHAWRLFTDADSARLEFLRARLSARVLVSEQQLVMEMQHQATVLNNLLMALEAEGYLMRVNVDGDSRWCERGLLARIHRYGLSSQRQRVKAVDPTRYLQFLFQWQGLGDDRREGGQSLQAALALLEGFPCPAAAWENDILPARMNGCFAHDLDSLFTSGQFMWMRPGAAGNRAGGQTIPVGNSSLLKNTPVILLPRNTEQLWKSLPAVRAGQVQLSSNAQTLQLILRQHGASFFIDLVSASGLLRTQVENALEELAANGLVTADSFAGLRALITPENRRPGFARRYRRRSHAPGIEAAGRWSLIPCEDGITGPDSWFTTGEEALEHIARVLLRRYGVVFHQVLKRETLIPPWRELLYVYRRLEARGEIRGGRFVAGFSGEQFALPEAAGLIQRLPADDSDFICISACDPLNLIGTIFNGEKVPALQGIRLVFKNGVPVARQNRDGLEYLQQVSADEEWRIRNLLIKKKMPPALVNSSPLQQH